MDMWDQIGVHRKENPASQVPRALLELTLCECNHHSARRWWGSLAFYELALAQLREVHKYMCLFVGALKNDVLTASQFRRPHAYVRKQRILRNVFDGRSVTGFRYTKHDIN